jgi:hypothetical protein
MTMAALTGTPAVVGPAASRTGATRAPVYEGASGTGADATVELAGALGEGDGFPSTSPGEIKVRAGITHRVFGGCCWTSV